MAKSIRTANDKIREPDLGANKDIDPGDKNSAERNTESKK